MYTKYLWIDFEKSQIITKAFQSIPSSGRKLNKVWVERNSNFYITSTKGVLKRNNMKFYFIEKVKKSDFAQKFINTHDSTIKLKAKDITHEKYIQCNADSKKITVEDLVRLSNTKMSFKSFIQVTRLKSLLLRKVSRTLCYETT